MAAESLEMDPVCNVREVHNSCVYVCEYIICVCVCSVKCMHAREGGV